MKNKGAKSLSEVKWTRRGERISREEEKPDEGDRSIDPELTEQSRW